MNDVKGMLQSKTVWGGILAVLAPAAAYIFHVNVTSADTTQIVDLVTGIASAVGGIVAIFGRIVATKQIG